MELDVCLPLPHDVPEKENAKVFASMAYSLFQQTMSPLNSECDLRILARTLIDSGTLDKESTNFLIDVIDACYETAQTFRVVTRLVQPWNLGHLFRKKIEFTILVSSYCRDKYSKQDRMGLLDWERAVDGYAPDVSVEDFIDDSHEDTLESDNVLRAGMLIYSLLSGQREMPQTLDDWPPNAPEPLDTITIKDGSDPWKYLRRTVANCFDTEHSRMTFQWLAWELQSETLSTCDIEESSSWESYEEENEEEDCHEERPRMSFFQFRCLVILWQKRWAKNKQVV